MEIEKKLIECLKNHELPDYLLYTGAGGTKNWMELDRSRTFPVARQLTSLLEKNLESLLRFIPTGMSLVSVGVGSGEKEELLLKALIRKNLAEPPASGEVPICYYPVDINSEFVDLALAKVRDLPVEKRGVAGFIEDIATFKKTGACRFFSAFWGTPFAITSQNSFFSLSVKHLGRRIYFSWMPAFSLLKVWKHNL